MHRKRAQLGQSPEIVTVPIRRDDSGRFSRHTKQWRGRYSLGGAAGERAWLPARRFAAKHEPRNFHLGAWGAAAAAAYSAYANKDKGDGGGGGSSPRPGTGAPSGATTAVSPVIQTEVSPQISPAMMQSQDSPGATQAMTATQYKPGGQTAEGGGVTPTSPLPAGSYRSTKAGGLPASYLDPVDITDIRDFPTAGDTIREIRQSEPFNWTPVYLLTAAALAGIGFLAYNRQQKAKPSAQGA